MQIYIYIYYKLVELVGGWSVIIQSDFTPVSHVTWTSRLLDQPGPEGRVGENHQMAQTDRQTDGHRNLETESANSVKSLWKKLAFYAYFKPSKNTKHCPSPLQPCTDRPNPVASCVFGQGWKEVFIILTILHCSSDRGNTVHCSTSSVVQCSAVQ